MRATRRRIRPDDDRAESDLLDSIELVAFPPDYFFTGRGCPARDPAVTRSSPTLVDGVRLLPNTEEVASRTANPFGFGIRFWRSDRHSGGRGREHRRAGFGETNSRVERPPETPAGVARYDPDSPVQAWGMGN